MSLDYILGGLLFLIGVVAAGVCVVARMPQFIESLMLIALGLIVMNTATSAAANKETRDILKSRNIN